VIADSSTIVAAREQVSRDLNGEMIILHLGTGHYYGINGVGNRIWELIQQPIRVSEVRDKLCAEFDVEPARCEQDLLELLQQLASRSLIVVDGAK
jgi:hypothetical protein